MSVPEAPDEPGRLYATSTTTWSAQAVTALQWTGEAELRVVVTRRCLDTASALRQITLAGRKARGSKLLEPIPGIG